MVMEVGYERSVQGGWVMRRRDHCGNIPIEGARIGALRPLSRGGG